MTATAIGTSNKLHWSLWGCLRAATATMTSSQNGLHGYQWECSHEKLCCRSRCRAVWLGLCMSYPFLKEINWAFYSLSISDRRDWSVGAGSPRPARTVGRRLSGTSTTCAPCTFFYRLWRWQLPCRPQNLCSLKMIGENQVSAEPIWIHCSPNKRLCIS